MPLKIKCRMKIGSREKGFIIWMVKLVKRINIFNRKTLSKGIKL
jgi:hypothetical protein